MRIKENDVRRRPAGDGCREEVYKFLLLGDAHGVPSLRMHRVGRLLRPHGQQTATKPRPAAITLHHGPERLLAQRCQTQTEHRWTISRESIVGNHVNEDLPEFYRSTMRGCNNNNASLGCVMANPDRGLVGVSIHFFSPPAFVI